MNRVEGFSASAVAKYPQQTQGLNGLPNELLFVAGQAAAAEMKQPKNHTLNALKELVNATMSGGVRKNVVLSVSVPEQGVDVVFSFSHGRAIMIKAEVLKTLGLTPEQCGQLDRINVSNGRVIFSKNGDVQAKAISITFEQQYGNCVLIAVYVGLLRENKEHGSGKCISSDGIIYIGEWKNGQLHGDGIYTDTSSCYVGGWQSNQMHGPGIYMKANGVMYDGNWGNGKLNGLGAVMCSKGGFRCNGWANGFLICDNIDFAGMVVNHDGSEFYSADSKEGQAMLIEFHRESKMAPNEPVDIETVIPPRVKLYMHDNKMHYTAMETTSGDNIIPWNNIMLVVRKEDIIPNGDKLTFSRCVVKNIDKKHSIECEGVSYDEAKHTYKGTMKFYVDGQLQGEYGGEFVMSHKHGVVPCGLGAMTVGSTTYAGTFAMDTGKAITPPDGVRLESGTVSYLGGKHTDTGKWNKNGEPIGTHEITYINSNGTKLIYKGTKVDKDGNPSNKQELQLVSSEGHIFSQVAIHSKSSNKNDEVLFGGYKVTSSTKVPDAAFFCLGGPDVVFYASAKTPDKFNLYYKNANGSVVSVPLTDGQRGEIRNMQKPSLQETSSTTLTMGPVTADQVKMWIDGGKLETLLPPNNKYKVKYSVDDIRDEYEGSLDGAHQPIGNGKMSMKNGDVLSGNFKTINGATLFEGKVFFDGTTYENEKIADITKYKYDMNIIKPQREKEAQEAVDKAKTDAKLNRTQLAKKSRNNIQEGLPKIQSKPAQLVQPHDATPEDLSDKQTAAITVAVTELNVVAATSHVESGVVGGSPVAAPVKRYIHNPYSLTEVTTEVTS